MDLFTSALYRLCWKNRLPHEGSGCCTNEFSGATAVNPTWSFLDGPPYANSALHMGNVRNKLLKAVSEGLLGYKRIDLIGSRLLFNWLAGKC